MEMQLTLDEASQMAVGSNLGAGKVFYCGSLIKNNSLSSCVHPLHVVICKTAVLTRYLIWCCSLLSLISYFGLILLTNQTFSSTSILMARYREVIFRKIKWLALKSCSKSPNSSKTVHSSSKCVR